MQQGSHVLHATLKRYQSPRGDELQLTIRLCLSFVFCISPRVGMSCNEELFRDELEDIEYQSPRGDELQLTNVTLYDFDCVVSVPAWG